MDLNGLPQTVQNFINDTIQYRESGNCLDYDTCQKILEYAADTGSQKLTGLGLYYLAECYWQKGEYENTMQCLTEGVSCLENARNILLALETEYRRIFARNLTLSRLSEAVILPLCPDKGSSMTYDLSRGASTYLDDDIELLKRMRFMTKEAKV